MPTNDRKVDHDQREALTHEISGTSRRRLLQLLGAGGAVVLAGCSEGNDGGTNTGTGTGTRTSTKSQKIAKSATIGLPSDITSDFHDKWGGVSPYYTRILEPLVWPTHDIKIKPWLAKDWERTGNLTWEFTLRNDVKFHNGKPLTAKAVKFSMNNGNIGFWGLKETKESTEEDKQYAVRKVDDLRVEFTTKEPAPNFPATATHLFGAIQHPDRNEKPIGTGPYKFESMKKGQHVKVTSFDDYWQGTAPNTPELTYRVISDDNTRALALTGNKIDVGLNLPPSQFDAIKNAKKTNAVTQTELITMNGYLNTVDGSFADVKLRKALNYAVAQTKVIKGGLNGIGQPARGPIPKIIYWSAHDSLPAYGPDKNKAKQLVQESNYNGETLELLAVPDDFFIPQPKLIAQVVQAEAKKVGMNIEIQMVPQSVMNDREKVPDGDIFFGGVGSLAAAADIMLQIYKGGEDAAYPWLGGPLSDKTISLIDKGSQAKDRQAKKDAYGTVQQKIMEKALILPFAYSEYVIGMRTDIGEFDFPPIAQSVRWEKLKRFK